MPLRIALVSKRKIFKGEELLYDYCAGTDQPQHGPVSDPESDPSSEAPSSPQPVAGSQRLVACRCGHAQCRRWIF